MGGFGGRIWTQAQSLSHHPVQLSVWRCNSQSRDPYSLCYPTALANIHLSILIRIGSEHFALLDSYEFGMLVDTLRYFSKHSSWHSSARLRRVCSWTPWNSERKSCCQNSFCWFTEAHWMLLSRCWFKHVGFARRHRCWSGNERYRCIDSCHVR